MVCVDEPTTNCGTLTPRPEPLTDRRPHGVVEPTPMKPAVVIVVVPVAPKAAEFALWKVENSEVVVAAWSDVPPVTAKKVEVA